MVGKYLKKKTQLKIKPLNLMFNFLIKKHKLRLTKWQRKFRISKYKLFWIGFGEGLFLGFLISFFSFIIKSSLS